jgi:hypothetical protein
MRKIRPVLNGLLVAGFLLGLNSVSGCGNPEEGSAPKMKGNKDEIQKAMQPGLPGKTAPTSKRGPGG